MNPMDDAALAAVLEAQPFSALMGARIERLGSDAIRVRIAIRDEFLQQNGFVHGGVLAYLADNAISFACGLHLGASLLTSGFSIEYLAPAIGPGWLDADATLVRGSRAKATARTDIFVRTDDGAARLCATALGACMRNTRTP